MPAFVERNAPWIVTAVIALLAVVAVVNKDLVVNGETRVHTLEMKVAQLEKYCCDELDCLKK